MPSLRRRLAAAVALAVPGTAGASPWLVEPAVTLGVEHQTNPEFRVADGPSSTQGYVGVAFPAEWRDGRYGAQLSVGGTLRQASGSTSARDQSDFGVSAAASRGADQGSVGVSASFGQTNLLGANAPDVGLNRAAGSERRYSVGTRADWRPTEYDALALDLRWSRTDYDASAAAGLVGNDDATAALSYSRALRPNLQALATASAIEYRPDGSAPSSRSASLQAGLGWLPAAGWTLRATYGRSRVRFAGRSAPSDVYDLSVARQTEFGTVSFSASQSFQASPFGSIAKRRGYGGGYSRALSERLASTISASRTENTELFRGLSFTKRNTDEATIGVSYALDEPWQVAGQLRYTRESYPETVFLRRRPAADSVFAGVSLQRRFGRVSVL
jgi:hypothetical protein